VQLHGSSQSNVPTSGILTGKEGIESMAKGRVKWFDKKKGYGFIEADGQGDVFVHYSNIEGDGFRLLKDGEQVSFEVENSPKGPHAVKVRKME
jgi:CspA family cold shock protein